MRVPFTCRAERPSRRFGVSTARVFISPVGVPISIGSLELPDIPPQPEPLMPDGLIASPAHGTAGVVGPGGDTTPSGAPRPRGRQGGRRNGGRDRPGRADGSAWPTAAAVGCTALALLGLSVGASAQPAAPAAPAPKPALAAAAGPAAESAAPPTTAGSTAAPAAPAAPAPPAAKRPAPVPVPDNPALLTDEKIGQSIEKAVDYLYKQFDPKTHMVSEAVGKVPDDSLPRRPGRPVPLRPDAGPTRPGHQGPPARLQGPGTAGDGRRPGEGGPHQGQPPDLRPRPAGHRPGAVRLHAAPARGQGRQAQRGLGRLRRRRPRHPGRRRLLPVRLRRRRLHLLP